MITFSSRLSRTAAALCVAASLLSLGTPLAQAESEYDVKAAYLFNFTKFVEWPSAAFAGGDAPFVIGIVGHDPFGGLDRLLQGKHTGDRSFEVRTMNAGDAAALRNCQMIFVTAAEEHRLGDILSAVRERPVLVVGEADGFASAGGMLGFNLQQSRLAVEVNSAAARQARLKISSHLLNIAKIVN